MKTSTAIGLMSGSSLDGLDIATVKFTMGSPNHIGFELLHHAAIEYPTEWQKKLSEAFYADAKTLKQLDLEYGQYLGEATARYIADTGCKPDLIASHGHTIFHRPEEGYTLQIGNGQAIANRCKTTVVNDFRSEDVSKGGQGAPLVPIGDRLLFGDYEVCLNIGGIANASYEKDGQRIAFDICIANQALNHLAQREGKKYDADGDMARQGKVVGELLNKLNDNAFYGKPAPKSLGREFFEANIRQLIETYPTADALCTFAEHIAMQVGQATNAIPSGRMLITGGGAYNKHLIGRIKAHSRHEIVIPDPDIIDFKEAIVFALLGFLRLEGITNVLKSVTGASEDSCSGEIACAPQSDEQQSAETQIATNHYLCTSKTIDR